MTFFVFPASSDRIEDLELEESLGVSLGKDPIPTAIAIRSDQIVAGESASPRGEIDREGLHTVIYHDDITTLVDISFAEFLRVMEAEGCEIRDLRDKRTR